MNLTDVDDKIIKRAQEQGKTIREVTAPVDRDLPSRSRVPAHPARGGLSEGDRLHPADDRARRAADRARRGVPGGGRLGLLRDRQVSRLRQALAPRHARGEDAARACSRTTTRKENAQDFALWKAAKPEDEAHGRGVGFTVGPRPPRLAPRVLGDGDGPARRDARPPLRRHRPHLPAPRGRDRAERSGDGEAVLALLVPRRVPAHRRREDGEARRATCSPCRGCARQGVSAAALRHFVFNTHYRKELNLSDEALEASMQGVRRVGDFADRLCDRRRSRWAARRSWRRRRTRPWRRPRRRCSTT